MNRGAVTDRDAGGRRRSVGAGHRRRSGIGLGTATRLVRDGAHVTICGRTEERLRSAVAHSRQVAGRRGGRLAGRARPRYVVADVTVEEQVAEAVAAAASERGRLDILFANAGGAIHMGPITEADVDQVRATVDLNLIGTFLCIKHGAPLMAAGVGTGVDGGEAPGGSIIGMSSGAGAFPHRYLWAYGAAKAGIDMLCQYAAEELGEHRSAGQHRAARDRRRRADGADHRRRPAARRVPGRRCRSAVWAPWRTSPPPSGSSPARSRRGSPARTWPSTAATISGGEPTTACCSASSESDGAPHHGRPPGGAEETAGATSTISRVKSSARPVRAQPATRAPGPKEDR